MLIFIDEGSTNQCDVCIQVNPLASLDISKLLDVSPLELRCPFVPFELIECPVTVTNGTDYYVSIWITPTYRDMFSYIRVEGHEYSDVESSRKVRLYRLYMMQPHSTCLMTMVRKQLPPQKDTCKFEMHMVLMPSKEHHTKFESDIHTMVNIYHTDYVNTELDLNSDIDSLKNAEELGGKVHRVMMTAVCDKVSLFVDKSTSVSSADSAICKFYLRHIKHIWCH